MNQTLTLKLDTPIPRALLADVEAKLGYVSEAVVGFRIDPGRSDEIQLQLKAGASPEEIEAKTRHLLAQMVAGWLPMAVKTLFDRRQVDVAFPPNVYGDLCARKWVIPMGPGQVALGGKALALLHYFDGIFTGWAAELDAEAMAYPQMIPKKTLDRCAYFSSFPHHVTFCSHLQSDVAILEAFSQDPDGFDLHSAMAGHDYVLNPAMCFHTYATLADGDLERPRVVTTVGHCHRFESTAMATLERLWDFKMREIIFIGSRDFVKDMRVKTRKRVENLMDELGLRCWIESANDPFFMTNYVAKSFHQLLTDAKFELQLSTSPDKSIAACSFNYHEDFFGKSYGMRLGEETAHTACTAFGLERWVYAFFCQFGLDDAAWPAPIRAALKP